MMKRHLYYLLDRSPWPLFGSIAALFLISGFVLTINKIEKGFFILFIIVELYLLFFILIKVLFFSNYYNNLKKSGKEKEYYYFFFVLVNRMIVKNIIYIFGIFNRIFFGVFSRSKVRIGNNNIKRRYYSNYYQFNNSLKEQMLKEINLLKKDEKITKKEFKLLKKYIEINYVHVKFGEIQIDNVTGKVILEAYDLTTKGEGKVYFHFNRKKDNYMKVYENKEGKESFVNKITIKRSFKDKEEFEKSVRIVKRGELEKKGIDKRGEEEIMEKLMNMHKDKDIEENKIFSMDEYKIKKERKIEFKKYEKDGNDDIIE